MTAKSKKFKAHAMRLLMAVMCMGFAFPVSADQCELGLNSGELSRMVELLPHPDFAEVLRRARIRLPEQMTNDGVAAALLPGGRLEYWQLLRMRQYLNREMFAEGTTEERRERLMQLMRATGPAFITMNEKPECLRPRSHVELVRARGGSQEELEEAKRRDAAARRLEQRRREQAAQRAQAASSAQVAAVSPESEAPAEEEQSTPAAQPDMVFTQEEYDSESRRRCVAEARAHFRVPQDFINTLNSAKSAVVAYRQQYLEDTAGQDWIQHVTGAQQSHCNGSVGRNLIAKRRETSQALRDLCGNNRDEEIRQICESVARLSAESGRTDLAVEVSDDVEERQREQIRRVGMEPMDTATREGFRRDMTERMREGGRLHPQFRRYRRLLAQSMYLERTQLVCHLDLAMMTVDSAQSFERQIQQLNQYNVYISTNWRSRSDAAGGRYLRAASQAIVGLIEQIGEEVNNCVIAGGPQAYMGSTSQSSSASADASQASGGAASAH